MCVLCLVYTCLFLRQNFCLFKQSGLNRLATRLFKKKKSSGAKKADVDEA